MTETILLWPLPLMQIEEQIKQGIFSCPKQLDLVNQIMILVSLYTHAVVDSSLTCSFWPQGRDAQSYAQPSRPFPVLSDGTSLVAVSSLPKCVENVKSFLI